jgi:hypothetical protein
MLEQSLLLSSQCYSSFEGLDLGFKHVHVLDQLYFLVLKCHSNSGKEGYVRRQSWPVSTYNSGISSVEYVYILQSYYRILSTSALFAFLSSTHEFPVSILSVPSDKMLLVPSNGPLPSSLSTVCRQILLCAPRNTQTKSKRSKQTCLFHA